MPYLFRSKGRKVHSCNLPSLYTVATSKPLPVAGDLWKCWRCKAVYEVIERDWWDREWKVLK